MLVFSVVIKLKRLFNANRFIGYFSVAAINIFLCEKVGRHGVRLYENRPFFGNEAYP